MSKHVSPKVQVAHAFVECGRTPAEVLAPATIISHCEGELAPFKVPRYIEFVPDFPRTSSNKIAKHAIAAAPADPRRQVYDRVQGRWTPGG